MTVWHSGLRQIRALNANVTREQAIDIFTGGLRGLIAGALQGDTRGISDLYIPYRMFRVQIRNHGKDEAGIFALEAFRGVMDLYQFSDVPDAAGVQSLTTRNVLPSTLEPQQANDALTAKLRGLIFARGFFRIRDLQLEVTPLETEICIPYWVCFRGNSDRLQLSLLDAVRRRLEGAKARHLVEEWLHTSPTPEIAHTDCRAAK